MVYWISMEKIVKGITFPRDMYKYGDQWVAINENGEEKYIVAADKDYDVLRTKLKENFSDTPVRYLKVPAEGATLTL